MSATTTPSTHFKYHNVIARGNKKNKQNFCPFQGRKACTNDHIKHCNLLLPAASISLVSLPRVRLVLAPSQSIWWEKFPLSCPLQSINKSTGYELMGKHEVASQGESTRADIWKVAFAAETSQEMCRHVTRMQDEMWRAPKFCRNDHRQVVTDTSLLKTCVYNQRRIKRWQIQEIISILASTQFTLKIRN